MGGGSASPVEVGAASHRVVAEIFLGFLVAEVLQRVGPQQVTHGPESGRLLKPIQLQRQNAQKKTNTSNAEKQAAVQIGILSGGANVPPSL